MAVSFLMSVTHGQSKSFFVLATKETNYQSQTPPTTPTYDKYLDYLMLHAKQIEAFIINNTTKRKSNSAEFDYLQPYTPSDPFYEDATNLSSYMINQDVDIIHNVQTH